MKSRIRPAASGQKAARRSLFGSRIQRRRAIHGLLFILPWLIGVIFFFIVPMVQSAVYAFCKVTLTSQGDQFQPVGFANFLYLFTQDPNFITNLSSSVLNMLYQVPVIVIFSLLSAMLLRKPFPGRTLVRAIFFFPVIIASGVVITILKEQVMMNAAVSREQAAYMFAAPSFSYFVEQLHFPQSLADLVENLINGFFDILWKSGVQIILLLAAVNHIGASAYEAADIEGASAWEKLWKITFPMIAPTVLVVLIYSIIDSFTDYGNRIMRMISEYFSLGQYEYSATLGLVYFVIVLVLVGLVNILVGRRVQYAVE